MSRGFIRGVAAGTVVAGLGFGALSVTTPLPQVAPPQPAPSPAAQEAATTPPPASSAPAPQAAPAMPAPAGSPTPAITVPAGSEFAHVGTDVSPAAPAGGDAPDAIASAPAAPSATGEGAQPLPGTEPAARPEAGSVAPAVPAAPETAQVALDTAPQAEAPVGVPPPGEAAAPALPQAEASAPEAAPAETPLPEIASVPAPAPEASTPAAPPPAMVLPAAPPTIVLPEVPDSAEPVVIATPDPVPDVVPAPESAPAQEAVTAEPEEGAAPALPHVFAPGSGSGFSNAPGTVVNRLPSVGSALAPHSGGTPGFKRPPGAETPAEDEAAAEVAPAPATPPADAVPVMPGAAGDSFAGARPKVNLGDDTPLRRFAGTYAPREGVPLYSVVILDVGVADGGLDPDTIAALGVPVTVAIDPMRPGAATDARAYRAAGVEVAILAGALPPEATVQDVEVSLEAWRQALPEAVALIEPGDPTFQGNENVGKEFVDALGSDGMALVTQAVGLDRAGQLARAAGVPNAQVWRVLDRRRDAAPAIVRTLSRGTFEASQRGSVMVMLSSWPESVSGLSQWIAQSGDAVSFVPASALALKSVGQ